MRKGLRNDSGQAILEYVLMVALAVGVVTLIGVGFRKTVFKVWKGMSRDVAAACPGCPPNPAVR
jgi:hypothetical protein